MDSRGDRHAGGGVLPARIDRCLVLTEPAPIHRAYRRAKYGADRKDAFTGIGDCLGRLIHRDATKPSNVRGLVRAASLAQAKRRLAYLHGTVSALRYLSGCTMAVTVRQDPRMNRSFEPSTPPRS